MSFVAGGWGMYPTLFLGILFVLGTIAHAAKPSARSRLFVIRMGLAELVSGLLGTVTGLIVTARVAGDRPDAVRVAIIGAGESANVIGLAFMMLTLGMLIMAFASWREPGEPAMEVKPETARPATA